MFWTASDGLFSMHILEVLNLAPFECLIFEIEFEIEVSTVGGKTLVFVDLTLVLVSQL